MSGHSMGDSFKDEAEKRTSQDIERGSGEHAVPGKDEVAPPAGPDADAPPDGGLDAWLTVAGGFCTVFASFGWINCEFLSLIENCLS